MLVSRYRAMGGYAAQHQLALSTKIIAAMSEFELACLVSLARPIARLRSGCPLVRRSSFLVYFERLAAMQLIVSFLACVAFFGHDVV